MKMIKNMRLKNNKEYLPVGTVQNSVLPRGTLTGSKLSKSPLVESPKMRPIHKNTTSRDIINVRRSGQTAAHLKVLENAQASKQRSKMDKSYMTDGWGVKQRWAAGKEYPYPLDSEQQQKVYPELNTTLSPKSHQ